MYVCMYVIQYPSYIHCTIFSCLILSIYCGNTRHTACFHFLVQLVTIYTVCLVDYYSCTIEAKSIKMDLIKIYYIIFIVVIKVIDLRSEHSLGLKVYNGNLTCSDNKLIHVESISFWSYSGDNYNEKTRKSCGYNRTNKDTGLTPTCNGHTSCIETINYIPSNCNGKTAVMFNYRCIDRDTSLIDMCEGIERDGGNRVFLTSPGYPQLSNNIKDKCRCSIMGTNITSITILDLRLVSGMDGTKSWFYIHFDNVYWRHASRSTMYNHKLPYVTTTSTTVNVKFTHNQINGQKLWMEVKGKALHVSCIHATTPASSSTQSTSTYQSSTISPSVSTTTSYESSTISPSVSTTTSYESSTISPSVSTTTSCESAVEADNLSTEKRVSNVDPGISPLLVGIIGLSVSNLLTLSCFIAFCVYRRRKSTLSESSTLQMRSITQGVAGTDETRNQQSVSPNNSRSSNYVIQPTRQTTNYKL